MTVPATPSSDDELTDGITALTPRLLAAMDAFEQVQRNMHPSRIPQLTTFISPFEEELHNAFESFKQLVFPAHIEKFVGFLTEAATYSLRACNGVTGNHQDPSARMKAMRAQSRAQEKLYPLAGILKPVSQYFLEAPMRENTGLLDLLNRDSTEGQAGLMHAANDRASRGGFSLYVPEYLDRKKPASVVVALHGGTGHGSDFIWAWLREARTRGFILLAPTSRQDTWSLMGEEHDLPSLLKMLYRLAENHAIDPEHILLTGMSDGATYSLLAGLRENSPFTHLAPFSGVLHPEISMRGQILHAKDRNIYLVHGDHDWMFPIETAYMAKAELEAAGANLVFRPIEGLSHTYARTENAALLDWFNPALKPG